MKHETQDLQAFVVDCEKDFGVRMPEHDADRILTLYDELCSLFEKHSGEGIPPWFFLP